MRDVERRRYRVVEFKGYRILDAQGRSGGNPAIDLHVVDERGRTRAVVPYDFARNIHYRRARARRLADRLNGHLFTVTVKSWRWRYFCHRCRGAWNRAAR